ncbi:MAG: hypothetical protein M3405_14735 [Acidobacteriota bacterium]|jgi:hypothetical protein|nr:hypothetical protein [Acidobacteriota bacterium]
MELLIIGAAIGAGFSGILLIARQIYLNWREKKKDKAKLLIKPLNSNRRIDSSIFEFLTPGNSIEAMRASLGVPNKKKQEEGAVHESTVTAGKTNSYLYLFENAWVKVTSKDDVSIDSLTVQSDEQKSKLNFGYFMVPFDFSEKTKWLLGRAKLSEEVVNNCSLDILKGRHDFSFAVTFQTGNPVYYFKHASKSYALSVQDFSCPSAKSMQN